MSHSTTTNLLHLVWSTRSRKNSIPEELLQQLWNYFIGTGYNKRIPVIAAGGICNHVHLGIELPPTIKLSDAISAFKANSSRWLKEQGVKDFSWQNGYGAFSFGIPQVDLVKKNTSIIRLNTTRNALSKRNFWNCWKRAGVNYDPRHVFE